MTENSNSSAQPETAIEETPMILRRLSQSLKAQDWLTISIEFVLLVLGVFLGIQVANWNAERVDRIEYGAALGRLGSEIEVNLAALDAFDPEMAKSLNIGSHALTVLQSCVDNAENLRTVNAGLEEIRGTSSLRLRRNALIEMTSNPRLLSQQTAEQRKRFSELLFYLESLQSDADYSERQPQERRMEDNPILRVGEPYAFTGKYLGFDWTITRRRLGLNVPFAEACRDNMLIKTFFNWERRQGGLPVIANKWRAELLATKKIIEARR
jgi:hypothetical protein